MAQPLNKLLLLFCVIPGLFISQTVNPIYTPPDYKTEGNFKNFKDRSEEISKWQINQLKNGALVVRLHNNVKLADQLKTKGEGDLAAQKEHEAYAINKNIVRAFTKAYDFSKVYFFYSEYSDTLLGGTRSGIFLDTNLMIDQSIRMNENFYLLAERDAIYNSSIGFVKEDTARYIKEKGNVTKDVPIILKNKYGHQLKDPFPFYASYNAKDFRKGNVTEYISVGGATVAVSLERRNSLAKWISYVQDLNAKLGKFYAQNQNYQVKNVDIQPYLY